jgi:hypothetical protein
MDEFVRVDRRSYQLSKRLFWYLNSTEPLAAQQFIYTASILANKRAILTILHFLGRYAKIP